MRKISVDEVQVGDTLAEAVTNERGKLLVPNGRELSATLINLIKRQGVRVVCVEGEDPDALNAQKLLDALEFRFAGMEEDELMMQIKQIARGHLAR